MPLTDGLNRRTFLKSAGLTALAGAVGADATIATAAAGGRFQAAGGRYDFDTPYNRVGTNSIKWDAALRTNNVDRLVAGMGIADMDFRCAPEITRALAERIEHENWGYLDMPQAFRQGIVDWNKRRYGIDVNIDLLGLTSGVHSGLIATLRAFCPPGSRVLLMTPTYNGFYSDLRWSDTLPADSLMKYENGRYHIDFEDLERQMTHDTHALILCNPQNPTGNCWTREELTRLGELCLRRRVVVLADEIHCDIINRGQTFTPFSTLDNRAVVDNSLTFQSASKSFSLAAMKCAWYFTTNPEYYAAVTAQSRFDISTLGMIAMKTALAEGEPWLRECVAYIDANHDFVQSYIPANIPLLKIGAKPEGTYLVWLDVSEVMEKIGAHEMAAEANSRLEPGATPVSADTLTARWFAREAGVALNAGPSYGTGGEGRMRMNIATSRQTLEAALDSIARALNGASLPTAAI